jgi:FeS assembly SUF system protein
MNDPTRMPAGPARPLDTPPTTVTDPTTTVPTVEPASAPTEGAPATPLDSAGRKALEERVVALLKEVYDPEIPVNIYDLGMIYDIRISDAAAAHVTMTLTSPMCPVAGTLPGEVETKIRSLPGVSAASVELTWEPPWDKEMISEAGKLVLNIF